MTATGAAAWVRPHYRKTDQRAFLLYWLFGEFAPERHVDAQRYRTHGLPAGIAGSVFAQDDLHRRDLHPLAGDLRNRMQAKAPAALMTADAAPHAMQLIGEIDDPPDLRYLRDTIGFVASVLDNGGAAMLDVQALTLRDRADYLREVFEPDTPQVRQEVVMLRSSDPRHPGRVWLHTRGLRKFARPDLSLRNVPMDVLFNAQLLLERAADYLLAGGVFDDGREVRMSVAPAGLIPTTDGKLDDPDFNNRHTEMIWPA